MILPGVDREAVPMMLALNDLRPQATSVTLGLHPTEVEADWQEELDEIFSHFDSGRRIVAVGEVGMDLYWDKTTADRQMQAFARQLDEARRRKLPVIIHSREALNETLEVLSDYRDVQAVFHCFGGTPEDVERIRAVSDCYFGIGGIVTFKNSHVDRSLPVIGIDRIVTETDAPWLAPVPHRGKRNESALMPLVAHRIADALGLTLADVDTRTTANARQLFNLGKK